MQNAIHELYGKQLRVRSCGICLQDKKLLLVNHSAIKSGDFWAPPGGGVSFNEKAETAVIREFLEETGLEVMVSKFLFACEFINYPLHSIELFFEVTVKGGILKKGSDPEMGGENQIIKDVKFVSEAEIKSMTPTALHGLFGLTRKPDEILRLSGYFKL